MASLKFCPQSLGPKPILHRLMAYVKGFIELCKMSVTILSSERKSTILWKVYRLMLIIGCVLTMKQDRIQVNIAIAMQTFLDSKHIAFQKNISSITQETDISFDYLNSSVS